MSRLPCLVPVAVLAALALAAPAADAAIVPQQGIKGIRLGMSVSQLRAKLGAPNAVGFSRSEIMGRVRSYRYGLTYARFDGDGRGAKVISVDTTSRAERVNGVGVGSRGVDVARRVPKVRCKREYGLSHCYRGSFLPGARVTDFLLGPDGRVRRVVVGFVID